MRHAPFYVVPLIWKCKYLRTTYGHVEYEVSVKSTRPLPHQTAPHFENDLAAPGTEWETKGVSTS